MNKYKIIYTDRNGKEDFFVHHSPTPEHALDVFRQNFGSHPEARVEFIRPTSKKELEAINNTGSQSPCKKWRNEIW